MPHVANGAGGTATSSKALSSSVSAASTDSSMEDLEPQYDLSEVGFPIAEPVPYFALVVREPNKIRLVNVGPEVVRCVQEKLQQLVKVESSGYVIFKVSQPSSRRSLAGLWNIKGAN